MLHVECSGIETNFFSRIFHNFSPNKIGRKTWRKARPCNDSLRSTVRLATDRQLSPDIYASTGDYCWLRASCWASHDRTRHGGNLILWLMSGCMESHIFHFKWFWWSFASKRRLNYENKKKITQNDNKCWAAVSAIAVPAAMKPIRLKSQLKRWMVDTPLEPRPRMILPPRKKRASAARDESHLRWMALTHPGWSAEWKP